MFPRIFPGQAVRGAGPGASLAGRVAHAQPELASGSGGGACGTLGAFIDEVLGQTGTTILRA